MFSDHSTKLLLVAAIAIAVPTGTYAKPNSYLGEHSAFSSDPVETAKREAERAKRKKERKMRREERRRKRLIEKNNRLN
ncbi:hypothetical protein [Ruegeria sp. A3M17]|uniref:hypothetical protein n=1 Tax=Ruegeria sp. A3M17 TaxID=2267229 RepID=UPI000DE8FEA1|nr:hypothetical protein [Ruegeria sp. A3M17]RBW60195.1 hypothetical protein DS906_06975 [Ruegeria sp. A3M17]